MNTLRVDGKTGMSGRNVRLPAPEGLADFFEVLVDGGFVFVGDGFGDFVAEVAAEAVAETVDGLAGGGVGKAEGLAHFGVVGLGVGEAKEGDEDGEVVGAAGGGEVFFLPGGGELEDAQGPLTVKDFFRRRFGREGLEGGFGGAGLEGKDGGAAASFFAVGVAVVVGDAALEDAEEEGAEEEGAEPARVGGGPGEKDGAVFEEVVVFQITW